MAVNPTNQVSANDFRVNDRASGNGVVSDVKRSEDFKASFNPGQFRGVTGSGQPMSPIAKNYAGRIAESVERGKVNAGREAYNNGSPAVRTSIDNAVKDVTESGLLTGQEAQEMGWMIAKVLGDKKC